MRSLLSNSRGFSVLEMVVAAAIMMTVTSAVFGLMNAEQDRSRAQLEVADVRQRLRVAQHTLYADLVMAGAGPFAGTAPPGVVGAVGADGAIRAAPGPLNDSFAPVLPFRVGAVGNAPAGAFTTDTITVIYVPPTIAQTTTSAVLDSAASPATLTVNETTGCPVNVKLCGLAAAMTVLVVDDSGNHDTFKVAAVSGGATSATGALTRDRPSGSAGVTYPVGSTVVEAVQRTYFLKNDPVTKVYQLMSYDGSTNADAPVVDHVVGLTFDYYGDSQPPVLRKPVSDPTGPWTTYGPRPPALGVKTTAYAAGENCAFLVDPATGRQAPRLAALDAGANPNALVPLTEAQLTDGPWCPDAESASRWDADLLRIRKIGVTLRVEAAVDALRGPAGVLFSHGGSSTRGSAWVPDEEVRFQVSPRNLNLGR